jgi:hypothetical protein
VISVYPAGKSSSWPWWSALQAAGVPIAASWPSWSFNQDGNEPGPDDYRNHAETCIKEATACDVLLLYVPDDEERHQFGALIEAGAALGAGKQVFLVSRHPWPFLRNHPRVRSFDSLSDAITAVMAMQAGARARAESDASRVTHSDSDLLARTPGAAGISAQLGPPSYTRRAKNGGGLMANNAPAGFLRARWRVQPGPSDVGAAS